MGWVQDFSNIFRPFGDCDGGSKNVIQIMLLTPRLVLTCGSSPELNGTMLYSLEQLIVSTVLISCNISFHFSESGEPLCLLSYIICWLLSGQKIIHSSSFIT